MAPLILSRAINTAHSLRDVLWEREHALHRDYRSPFPDSWQVDADLCRTIVIAWPNRYDWMYTHQWVGHLLHGLRARVRIARADFPQPYTRIVMLRVDTGTRTHEVAVDYNDDASQIDLDCLSRSLVYFKMQYLADGYGDSRIVPGGYINKSLDYYKYLPHLRRRYDTERPKFDVYGRFGLQFAGAIRTEALGLLRQQRDFHFEGSGRLVRYSQSLREAAQSRLNIDLPGNGDFCFRLMDYLGIGTCVIARAHGTVMPVPLRDREHIVLAQPDLSDLVDLCRWFLENPEERQRIARNAREYFDRYLHRDQLAAYYLHQIAKCID